MPLDPLGNSALSGHRRILGVCWIVYGIARLLMAILLAMHTGTATVMFGALLVRVRDPFTLMDIFHLVYMGIIVWSVLCGILGILAGLALLGGQSAGRKLALAAGFLSLPGIPFGTTLGIYTLIIFLP
jgi:hypothetical protein